MKNLVLLFIFVFSPLAFNVSGNVGSPEIDKLEMVEKEATPKTVKDELMEAFSAWKKAEASYYDPNDSTQTKEAADGKGTSGRLIQSGSISLGASFAKIIHDEGMEVFLEVNLPILTPYGKGIFRVDDTMAERYAKSNKVHIDFFHEDLDSRHKRLGRFKIQFRIFKISNGSKRTKALQTPRYVVKVS